MRWQIASDCNFFVATSREEKRPCCLAGDGNVCDRNAQRFAIAIFGLSQVMTTLLENQKFSTAAVNMAHSAGYTALHVAVKRGHCHALSGTGSATLSRESGVSESCDSKVEATVFSGTAQAQPQLEYPPKRFASVVRYCRKPLPGPRPRESQNPPGTKKKFPKT